MHGCNNSPNGEHFWSNPRHVPKYSTSGPFPPTNTGGEVYRIVQRRECLWCSEVDLKDMPLTVVGAAP